MGKVVKTKVHKVHNVHNLEDFYLESPISSCPHTLSRGWCLNCVEDLMDSYEARITHLEGEQEILRDEIEILEGQVSDLERRRKDVPDRKKAITIDDLFNDLD